jgi:N utilization substance protein B
MSTRRQVRERVLQALYAQEISGDTPEHVLKTLIRPTFEGEKTYVRFAEKLFVRSLDVRSAADVLLDKHVQNWELSRLALTDRLVLRLAVAEFLHFADIPPKVTINEAVDIARAFGSEKSGAFVNGVLDAVLQDLRDDDRIQKSGRGLVNTSPKAGPPKAGAKG